MKKRGKIIGAGLLIMAFALLPCLSMAGSLEPSEPPGPTMHTLDEIYKKVSNVTRFPQCDGRRFLDLTDGTVADCESGLIWMRDANCFGPQSWSNAINICHELTSGNCTLVDDSAAGDWHLPSIRELESLVDHNYTDPALSNGDGTAHWVEGDAFISVQSGDSPQGDYWSATTYYDLPDFVKVVNMGSGSTYGGVKTGLWRYVWCVRGGR